MNYAELKEIISEPFFINWLGINVGFLLLGVLLGKMFFTKSKSNSAYKEALESAKKEFEGEKKEFSNDVTEQLAELRDGILNSAKAYQKAIDVIGGHIGSTESLNNLLLEHKQEENKNVIEEIADKIDQKVSEGGLSEMLGTEQAEGIKKQANA